MASPTSAREEKRGGLSINLEELDSANKVLMFNPEENGSADAGVKGWRRDDLFDANKFFSSTFSTTTVQADQWPIHTNLTPR